MRFNNRFFFALLTVFVTLFSSKSGVYGLPLPRPAAKVEVSVPKPVQKRADPDDREDQMLALRAFMDDVQSLGGSPYGRALMRRTMPVATPDKVGMPTQLKASSSGFIFLPVVGANAGQASSSSSAPSDSQEKVGAAPIRQTMFINIEAPSGGQLAHIDIPGVKGDPKKDEPCLDDENKDAGVAAPAGGAAQDSDPSKQGSKAQTQGADQRGNGAGATGNDAVAQDGPGADANQPAVGGDQSQDKAAAAAGQDDSKADTKPDLSKTTPPDAKVDPATPAQNGTAALATGTGIASVTPKAKTELQAPPGIDESKKMKVVFKPLVDPEATTTPPPVITAPPAADNKAAVPAVQADSPPPGPTPDLSNTGAAPDNADDKKPDSKSGAAGGAASTSTQFDADTNANANSNANANLSAAANPAANPPPAVDGGAVQGATSAPPDTPPASLAIANATAIPAATVPPATGPPASTVNNAAVGSNKDYFIYPVEQNDKLVDLKKGDMVAYVDKSGNISNDGGGDAVRQLLAGGGTAPPPPASLPATTPPASTTTPPLTKRTHPRMWDLERRAIPEKQAIPKKKRAEAGEEKKGFKLRPGIQGGSIAYYGQPAVRRRSIRL